ncbi:hypothetical protein KUCAC02_023427 [Chaenocephalus aceratus]|uniref:Uncharacterized protein n=1 Tax=Chaenocephalus aceratus TaxID=36190 RepID=A0ACB9XRS0_CHAAC|nr:hypothetical protein KUCAC02_023427 [Chaenocephalus aceratus]
MSPPPAFVTLLNGGQAQDAIRSLHHSTVRGRLINVTLQPTDSMLCLTNLPHTFTAQQLEEMVRAYGNIERSFLVYSLLTGHSKGYGFVEYMKKDSASRARSELLGRPIEDRSLMVQWMDVNQLGQEENLHSRCLCINRLPLDLCDSEELTQLFSKTYKPVFCQVGGADPGSSITIGHSHIITRQLFPCLMLLTHFYITMLAQDEGSPVRGFGVVEYESAEQAEAVLIEMDRTLVGGQEVRLSLCSPGTTGRSTLAALIAAQGKYGRHANLPFLRPPLTTALLTLGKAHQNALLGNGLVLQNLLHMQLAQQQLLHIKDKRISSVCSLLGDPSRLLIQKALSMRPPGLVPLGKGLLGDSPTELGQESVQLSTHNASVVVSAAGVVPYLQGRAGEQNSNHAISTHPSASFSCDRQPAPPGTLGGCHPQGQGYSLGITHSGLGPPPPIPPGGVYTSAGQHSSSDGCPLASMVSNGQGSLLGDPPKEVRMPSNPYLNLASVMPGVVLQGSVGSKAQGGPPGSGVYGSPVVSQGSGSYSHSAAATTTAQYTTDTSNDYSQYNQAYTQEAMQQWYQHYQAQAHSYKRRRSARQHGHRLQQGAHTGSSSDHLWGLQTPTCRLSLSTTLSLLQPARPTSEVDVCKPLECLCTQSPVTHPAAPDWNTYYYNQTRGHKREYPQLAVQEVTASDGAYIGQHSQGLGGQYADYFKRKRL